MSDDQSISDSVQLPLFDPVTITLTKGHKTIVDPIDADLQNIKWHSVCKKGRVYAAHRTSSRYLYLHIVIMERIFGISIDKKDRVDHIDNDPLNNRRNNLRIATHAENIHNSKRQSNNTSGYKGVSYFRPAKLWQAYIRVNGTRIHLGYFHSAQEAYVAYCNAARKYFGEFARLE